MIGKFRYADALKYPYQHYLNTMILPGAIVYVEMVCWWVLIIIAVILAVAVTESVAGTATGLGFITEPAGALWASLQQLPGSSAAASPDTPILMLAEAGSEGDFNWSNMNPNNFNFNFGGNAGPVYFLLWCGYEWRLYGHWHQHGLDAEPPAWTEHFPGIIKDGLKGAAFYAALRFLIGSIVLFPLLLFAATNWDALANSFHELTQAVKTEDSPPEWFFSLFFALLGFYLLFAIVDFFMAPFFIAPLIHSSSDRTLANLFDWDKTMATGAAHYGNVLIAFLLIGVTAVLYTVGGLIVGFATCCIGFLLFPFLFMGGFRTTAAHLLAQAYGLGESATPAPEANVSA